MRVERAPLLSITDCGRSFGDDWVVRGVDVTVDSPGVVGIVGGNGSGKTTLLRMIAGLLAPSAGRIEIAGSDIRSGNGARGRVGFASHTPIAYPEESVRSNLRFAAALRGVGRKRARVMADDAIEQWTLTDVAGTAVGILSRGWKQRYALARAGLGNPCVLALDEPTVGLDEDGRALVEDAIAAWRRRCAVLVASHERPWLETLSDQMLTIDAPQAVGQRDARPPTTSLVTP